MTVGYVSKVGNIAEKQYIPVTIYSVQRCNDSFNNRGSNLRVKTPYTKGYDLKPLDLNV